MLNTARSVVDHLITRTLDAPTEDRASGAGIVTRRHGKMKMRTASRDAHGRPRAARADEEREISDGIAGDVQSPEGGEFVH